MTEHESAAVTPWYELSGMEREIAKYDQCEEPGDCDHDHDNAIEYFREQELAGLRTELAAATERAELAEAQVAEIQAERNEWQRRANRDRTVAEILRADLHAANERAEKVEAERDQYAREYHRLDSEQAAAGSYALRAERAEAERDEAWVRLAELGEATVEWSIRWREDGDVSGKPHTEAEARERAGANPRTLALVRRLVTDWRDTEPADAAQDGRSATETETVQ
ncbi:MAG: hypothetical protein HOY79_17670 [Streptomyces sp.]|nr:hypothetical protein [Streptomyces sp.]